MTNKTKHKIGRFSKDFGSSLPWTLRNSGKQALGLGPLVSETQHCINTALSVLFYHFKSQAPGSVGCVSPVTDIPQLRVNPLQCLPQEEAPLVLMKVLILHDRHWGFSRRAVAKKWALKWVGRHSASTLQSKRAAWRVLLIDRGLEVNREGNLEEFDNINKPHIVFWLVITHGSLY